MRKEGFIVQKQDQRCSQLERAPADGRTRYFGSENLEGLMPFI